MIYNNKTDSNWNKVNNE